MKITVTDHNGKVHKVKQPYEGAAYVATELTCPHCDEENIHVAGTGKCVDPERRHDTYRADAIHYSTKCGKRVGTIRCKMNTLFGLEEDERVFSMGVKIY